MTIETTDNDNIDNEDKGSADVEVVTYTQADVDALNLKLTESADENTRMRGHNSKLLDEKKLSQKAAQDAQDALDLESASKLSSEEFEKTLNSQWQGKLNTKDELHAEELGVWKKQVLGGKEDTAIAQLSADFKNPELFKQLLSSMTKANLEDGKVGLTFSDSTGKQVSSTVEGMRDWIKGNSMFAEHLKGIDSDGGYDGKTNPADKASQTKISRADFEKLPASEKPKRAKDVI